METDSYMIPYAVLEHIRTPISVFLPLNTDKVQPYLSPCVFE